jgi:hypothetical protein
LRDITLRIDFSLSNPVAGAFFCDQRTNPSLRYPYFYTSNQFQQPRTWFPCVEESTERCTWEMVLFSLREV